MGSEQDFDRRPTGGGEYFTVRLRGDRWTPGCFVCDGREVCGPGEGVHRYIAGEVVAQGAAARVTALFTSGVFAQRLSADVNEAALQLDSACETGPWLREGYYVVVGACQRHRRNLKYLEALCSKGTVSPNVITERFVAEAKELP